MSYTISFGEKGSLQIKISGKLAGHAARDVMEFIKFVVERGVKNIRLDLRQTTSVDSLGIAVFDWIHTQNASVKVSVLPPLKGVTDDELALIAGVPNGWVFNSTRDYLYEKLMTSIS
jgi:ABC-type transporter Mla MlaB component